MTSRCTIFVWWVFSSYYSHWPLFKCIVSAVVFIKSTTKVRGFRGNSWLFEGGHQKWDKASIKTCKLCGLQFYIFEPHNRKIFRFQTCYYCKLKGANIGCCRKSCRKSFHLPCALENNCLVQFRDKFPSFCHIHHGIERTSIHAKDEICLLCSKDMKEFHPVTSVQLNCCESKWYHSDCLRDLAFVEQNKFTCPCCGDCDDFRDSMLSNGIYVYEK